MNNELTCKSVMCQCDTDQQIPWFNSYQLTVTGMSNIKEGRYKPRLHVSVNLIAGAWSMASILVNFTFVVMGTGTCP